MNPTSRYLRYSEVMAARFGGKAYKIPINLPVTCPNRDGRISTGGCTFCGADGAGFECQADTVPVAEQFRRNAEYIGKKYKAEHFIAYFQNFSNTYMAPTDLAEALSALEGLPVTGVSLSTRPDAVAQEHLEVLKGFQQRLGWHITLEYGLQTVNYHTLDSINRGHGLAEFIDAVIRTHGAGFEVCAHMILNLPGDTERDVLEGAAILAALQVRQVKLHGLYILRGTPMGDAYARGEIAMISAEAYVDRVVSFIRHSSPELVFQRLTGRAPESETLFCNWGMSWWRLQEMIEQRLESLDARQGDRCSRMGGSAVSHWIERA